MSISNRAHRQLVVVAARRLAFGHKPEAHAAARGVALVGALVGVREAAAQIGCIDGDRLRHRLPSQVGRIPEVALVRQALEQVCAAASPEKVGITNQVYLGPSTMPL